MAFAPARRLTPHNHSSARAGSKPRTSRVGSPSGRGVREGRRPDAPVSYFTMKEPFAFLRKPQAQPRSVATVEAAANPPQRFPSPSAATAAPHDGEAVHNSTLVNYGAPTYNGGQQRHNAVVTRGGKAGRGWTNGTGASRSASSSPSPQPRPTRSQQLRREYNTQRDWDGGRAKKKDQLASLVASEEHAQSRPGSPYHPSSEPVTPRAARPGRRGRDLPQQKQSWLPPSEMLSYVSRIVGRPQSTDSGDRPKRADRTERAPAQLRSRGRPSGRGGAAATTRRLHAPCEDGAEAAGPSSDSGVNSTTVANPYIRSVLQGRETRWIPPSLAAEKPNPRTRSQSLTQYSTYQQHQEMSPYLSRQHLFEAWQENQRAGSQQPRLSVPMEAAHRPDGGGGGRRSSSGCSSGDSSTTSSTVSTPSHDKGDHRKVRSKRYHRTRGTRSRGEEGTPRKVAEPQHRIFPLSFPASARGQVEGQDTTHGGWNDRSPRMRRAATKGLDGECRTSKHNGSKRRRRRSGGHRGRHDDFEVDDSDSSSVSESRSSASRSLSSSDGSRHREHLSRKRSQRQRSSRHGDYQGEGRARDVSSGSPKPGHRQRKLDGGTVLSLSDALRRKQRIGLRERLKNEARQREEGSQMVSAAAVPDDEDSRAYLMSPGNRGESSGREGPTNRSVRPRDSKRDWLGGSPLLTKSRESQLFGSKEDKYLATPLFERSFQSAQRRSPLASGGASLGVVAEVMHPHGIRGVEGSLLSLVRLPRTYHFNNVADGISGALGGDSTHYVVTAPAAHAVTTDRSRSSARQQKRHSRRGHSELTRCAELDARKNGLANVFVGSGTKLSHAAGTASLLEPPQAAPSQGRRKEKSAMPNTEEAPEKSNRSSKSKYGAILSGLFETVGSHGVEPVLPDDTRDLSCMKPFPAAPLRDPLRSEYMASVCDESDSMPALNAAGAVAFALTLNPSSAVGHRHTDKPLGAHATAGERFARLSQPSHVTLVGPTAGASPPGVFAEATSSAIHMPQGEHGTLSAAQQAFWLRQRANGDRLYGLNNSTLPSGGALLLESTAHHGSARQQSNHSARQPTPSLTRELWEARRREASGVLVNGSLSGAEVTFACASCGERRQRGTCCGTCGATPLALCPCASCGTVGRGPFCTHCNHRREDLS